MNDLPLGGRYCTLVQTVEHDGLTFSAGDTVRCRQQWSGRQPNGKLGTGWREHIATLDEIYLEDHPNVGETMVFAEATSEGQRIRIWFRRDRPVPYELGVVDAPPPIEGMLW